MVWSGHSHVVWRAHLPPLICVIPLIDMARVSQSGTCGVGIQSRFPVRTYYSRPAVQGRRALLARRRWWNWSLKGGDRGASRKPIKPRRPPFISLVLSLSWPFRHSGTDEVIGEIWELVIAWIWYTPLHFFSISSKINSTPRTRWMTTTRRQDHGITLCSTYEKWSTFCIGRWEEEYPICTTSQSYELDAN